MASPNPSQPASEGSARTDAITSSDNSSRSASSASTVKLRSWAFARHELAQHAIARDRLEAGMQRRQLDRDARPLGQRAIAALAPDRGDGARIGVEISRGDAPGARALAKHVERIARRAIVRRARQRLVDVASE